MQESNKIVDKLAAIDGPAGLDDMSRDEAASINIYTQDSPVYKVLNRMLLKGDRDPLKQWFPYLKLLLTALHKLPSCPGTYFRGVSADIASQYTKGTKMVWWPFSSSTATIEALGAFMEPGEPRVLFSLEVQRVVDISKFSSFAEDEVADGVGEDERLLIAGIPLEVKSIIALPDNITMVQMTEDLDRPPLIPGFMLKPPPPAEVPASDRPPVDILVIVDYPTNGGGGGGAIEPAKYIAPFQALQAALNARFVGTQARIRFHTPRSIVVDDEDLLKERIPCVCWIAIGEEASTVEDLTFATSLWKARGGRCDFAIVLMKHGAENRSRALLENECADRTLWVSADYTDTPIANGFLADRKSSAAAIPEVLYAALSGTAFNNERTAHKCCSNVLELAKNRGVDAGIKIIESCTEIPQVMKGDELPVDGVGISLSSADSDPAELTSKLVGAPKHSSVDLNQWSQVCDLLRTLDEGRSGLHVMAVTGGTDAERKSVAWTAVQSYIAVAGRFKLVVYRNADLPESSRENPETFDLPFDTHGGQDVLVWMNSESELPLEALREAIDAFVEDDGMPLPWTFILTSQSDFDDIEDEFADVTDEISLQEAIGTSVNESSEDLIRIVPADPTLKVLSILEVLNAAELLNLLVAALPQIASESLSDRGARDYIDQLLVGDNNSVVVRGMAPNTRFLFELRNDLIDGSLDERINKLVRDFVEDGSDLGGQVWTLDKSAFANIYPKILSQMDQLSPHQREKLQECEASRRVHVTGPAGCGKTFIALHMVVDLIEAAGSTSKSISQESPILFVGKNEALCRFFVNWILLRLRKKKKTKAAKVAMSDYVRVLHTSPFEDQVFALDFGSGGKMDFVKAKVSSNHSLVIVDEAHHIFAAGAGPSADDAAKVTELCLTAGRSLLLSDISQSGAAGAVVFPPDHKDVVLKEVVRNSSRIVTASLPFCRSVDLDDVTCIHGVRGPPLEPFMFNHCGGDGIARYTKYVEGIIHGLKHMNDTYPGVEIHDNLVILVPDLKFKDELQRRLTLAINEQIPAPGMSIVGAVDGAFAERKRREREPSRIVLDTLESFDGMERLFVFAVGLDSVKTTEGCCGIYRAITRAHMFVCVVQEHLKGGWLEFTAAIQSDGHVDFDEAKERERVARENLKVIESSSADEAAATSHVEQKGNASKENADQNTNSNNGNITVAGEVKVDLFDRTATADGLNHANPIQGIESPKINLARKDDRVDEEAPSLVLTSNVWGTNLNSKAFSGTISNLSFNPMNPNTLQDKWTVIASFVVVREHASLSSTEVHRLAHGDEVYVVGQETLADADRTERLQISTSSGTIGWVTRHLASSVPGESSGTTLLVPVMNPIPPQEFDEKAIRVELWSRDESVQARVVSQYNEEVARLKEMFGQIDDFWNTAAFTAEHIGSTAVPNLPAKPYVDIYLHPISKTAAASQEARVERVQLAMQKCGYMIFDKDLSIYFRDVDAGYRGQGKKELNQRNTICVLGFFVHIEPEIAPSAHSLGLMQHRDDLRSNTALRQQYLTAKQKATSGGAAGFSEYTANKIENYFSAEGGNEDSPPKPKEIPASKTVVKTAFRLGGPNAYEFQDWDSYSYRSKGRAVKAYDRRITDHCKITNWDKTLIRANQIPPEAASNPHGVGCKGCTRFFHLDKRWPSYMHKGCEYIFCESCAWLVKKNLPVEWPGRARSESTSIKNSGR